MARKDLDIWIKFLLIGAEVLFVGILSLMRIAITGWLVLIFGFLLIAWVVFHLVLMSVFILNLRSSTLDMVLYIAVHLSYLLAWLFQSDADDVQVRWVIQLFPFTGGLEPFLAAWGNTLFLITTAATLVCYAVIFILVIVRIVQFLVSLNKDAQAA